MRRQKLAVATVCLAAAAWPGFGRSRPAADLRVPICLDYQDGGDHTAANFSKVIASRMFRTIGVTLIWVNSRSCQPEGVCISLTGNTPGTLFPGALAYATPFEGTQIRVFGDRIEAHKPSLVPHLLAHVLVHEIVHILEGCTWHSDRGVMKAAWDDADYSRMLWADLPIASEDIDLVRAGIEKRARLSGAHKNQDSSTLDLAPTLVQHWQHR